jgi:hypothetical protein
LTAIAALDSLVCPPAPLPMPSHGSTQFKPLFGFETRDLPALPNIEAYLPESFTLDLQIKDSDNLPKEWRPAMAKCSGTRWALLVGFLLSGLSAGERAAPPVKGPLPSVLQAFTEHIRATESRLEAQLRGEQGFLWATTAERRDQLRQGQVVCDPGYGKGEITVSHGLIHDWVGAIFIPNASVEEVLLLIQDYDNHKNIYKPEVIDSQLIERRGDDFKIRLRLLKKKVITVVLETEHEARYRQIAPHWWSSASHTTRIAEIEDYGQAGQRERPAGQDRGFLWRLNSYWSIREREGGAFVECEAISLTRSVPTGLGWLIEPIIRSLAKDSLVNTLRATQAAVLNSRANAARPSPMQAADR